MPGGTGYGEATQTSPAIHTWGTPINAPIRAWRRLTAPLLIALLLAAGCSSGDQQDAFVETGGFTSTFPTQTEEVNDIGLNYGYLDNKTDAPVHLISVQFAPVPAGLHTLDVLAYTWADTHDTGLLSGAGVLSKECPHEYRPHPLSVVTVAPHANANWLVVIAFTIAKPGVYHLNQVRIDYETQGHHGWQYQNINTTVTVKNPPLPGPTPLPRSAICYDPKTDP